MQQLGRRERAVKPSKGLRAGASVCLLFCFWFFTHAVDQSLQLAGVESLPFSFSRIHEDSRTNPLPVRCYMEPRMLLSASLLLIGLAVWSRSIHFSTSERHFHIEGALKKKKHLFFAEVLFLCFGRNFFLKDLLAGDTFLHDSY